MKQKEVQQWNKYIDVKNKIRRRKFILSPCFDVTVETIMYYIDLASGKPFIKRFAGIIQNFVPGLIPFQ